MWAGGGFGFWPSYFPDARVSWVSPFKKLGGEAEARRSTFNITAMMGSKNSFSYRIQFEAIGHI